jgi:hypothetical protein
MCNCVQKERQQHPRLGYYNYMFECKQGNRKHFITIQELTNDTQAKSLAEEKCREIYED